MVKSRRNNRYNRLRNSSDHPVVDSADVINESEFNSNNESDNNSEIGEATSNFHINVLDSLQHKFRIDASPNWTISELKIASESVTHVPPASQRLVYMGRLLSDEKTLSDEKIENESIIHLFPKPNIIIHSNEAEEACNNGAQQQNNLDDNGAHVPQIILDIEEARRSQSMSVLLTSAEMFEAQHRVKLLAFLLLIICSMELLTLFTIMLGVPQSGQEDDIPPGDPTDASFSSATQVEMRTWRNSDYADLIINAFGFYVATLGIKATTDNTLHTAKKYYFGLIITGLAWITYYYYINVAQAKADQEANMDTNSTDFANIDNYSNTTSSNVYVDSFYGIMIPICVWAICFVRAWQFQSMIAQAEQEMQLRLDEILGNSSPHNEDQEELSLQEENNIV